MFHPELISFFALIQRSKDLGDGWREFSKATKQLVITNDRKFPGLFEVDLESYKVRVSTEGHVLVKWMNYVPK